MSKSFEHKIQLQLSDSFGLPVPGTEFWVSLTITKKGNKVTIQLPVINFQIGPTSPNDPFPPQLPGGFLFTSDGFLPENLRPNDLVYRSFLVPSNNGMSQSFSFTVTPTPPYANIPIGYILSVTNAGAIVVQAAGTFGNIIPPGPQILMPTDINYIIKPKIKLDKNYIIDPGFTNTTQFTNPNAAVDGIRDTHVNDAFDGVVVWSWQNNANIADKTNGITNLFVAIGTINNDGILSIGVPVRLTDFPAGFGIFDTAVTINRTNKNNIVVSYGLANYNVPFTSVCRAVSFDGGKTWPAPFDGTNVVPFNGLTNIQPTGSSTIRFNDNRGVASDTFGNIWYGTTNAFDNFGNFIGQPTFWISIDGGDTYSVAYTAPAPAAGFEYDFPQFCFGGDGLGNYGLHFVVDYLNEVTNDQNFAVGFIPITGIGAIGTPSFAQLTSLSNVNTISCITASSDGRVWTMGYPPGFTPTFIPMVGNGNRLIRMIFKSPGPLDQNYAGPWNFAMVNLLPVTAFYPALYDSQPDGLGYFNSAQNVIYDNKRQALYQMTIGNFPDWSQNMRLYFAISRDNGQTWSSPIDISNSDFANRGFQSMALDAKTGNLVFGWYDGRNDPTLKSVQYFGAIITAKELDELVKKIPLSNPLYTIPPATITSIQPNIELTEAQKIILAKRKKICRKRFGRPERVDKP